MTNFEWLKKNEKILKDTLANGLAVYAHSNEIAECGNIPCWDCSFREHDLTKKCSDLRKEWLNEEHESLYKEGDIVMVEALGCSDLETLIGIVSKDNEDGTVLLSRYTSNVNQRTGVQYYTKDIIQKFGNIYEKTDEEVKEND